MPGRHAAPDRSRLHREIIRYIIILAVLAVVLVGGAVLLSGLLAESGDTTLTTVLQAETTTSVLPETISTQSTTVATTTTTQPSTTTTTEAATTTTLPPVLEPSDVTVLVLNSTDTSGMAGRLTARLVDLGYQALEPDNYSPLLNLSRVWFAEGFDREAAILAEQLPDAIVEPRPEGESDESDITVVLGASFDE